MSTALRKKMHQDLQLAGLSAGTQDVYLRVVSQLAVHFDTPPDRLSEQQVRNLLAPIASASSASCTLGAGPCSTTRTCTTSCRGAGLTRVATRWLPSRADFLVPVEALSILFRAKFRDILARQGLLHLVRSGS